MSTSNHTEAFQLLQFIPFRLNRLTSEVSDHLSVVYRERFGLDIPEWRILVTIGPDRCCTAQYIAKCTRMHKTRVSRATAQLVQMAMIERAPSAADSREIELRLSTKGRAVYDELVPLALEREKELLSCLNAEELRGLISGLDRLEEYLGLSRLEK